MDHAFLSSTMVGRNKGKAACIPGTGNKDRGGIIPRQLGTSCWGKTTKAGMLMNTGIGEILDHSNVVAKS